MRRTVIALMLGFFFLAAGLFGCGEHEEKGAGDGPGISGAITLSTTGAGVFQVSLTLFGSGSGNTFTDSNGFYSFPGLQDGTYTIVPSKTGFTFLPPTLTFAISGASLTDQNFLAYATAPADPANHDSVDFAQRKEAALASAGGSADFPSTPSQGR